MIEKRSTSIRIPLRPSEVERIKAAAAAAGEPTTVWLRELALAAADQQGSKA